MENNHVNLYLNMFLIKNNYASYKFITFSDKYEIEEISYIIYIGLNTHSFVKRFLFATNSFF